MKRRLKITLTTVISLVLIITAGFFIYVSNYYHAEEVALAVMKNGKNLEVQDDYIVLSPSSPSDTGMIFYPGGKVEHLAYLPMMEKITAQTGITTILVKMPFNLAVFGASKADQVIEQFPDLTDWYIGGHSLGGAMASDYASKNQTKVDGLILMGAYIYGDYPSDRTLTIYGTLETDVAQEIDYTDNVVAIEGGNHAQFGHYGKQKGDPDATVSREDQQRIAVEAIQTFLFSRED
ncbi:alpha/beta hydrolase [Amphibacillus indicireducens]|uniref:Alpha/beta hydrolase n=1 Tax=Amphibacillus indicireducens TaxID=1076330 RepID=A0ABP7VAA9_9BACI